MKEETRRSCGCCLGCGGVLALILVMAAVVPGFDLSEPWAWGMAAVMAAAGVELWFRGGGALVLALACLAGGLWGAVVGKGPLVAWCARIYGALLWPGHDLAWRLGSGLDPAGRDLLALALGGGALGAGLGLGRGLWEIGRRLEAAGATLAAWAGALLLLSVGPSRAELAAERPSGAVQAEAPARVEQPLTPITVPSERVRGGSDRASGRRVAIRGELEVEATEMPQQLWAQLMGDNPSICEAEGACSAEMPVQGMTWNEALQAANALSARTSLPAAYRYERGQAVWISGSTGWRLPTEAEWEHIARAGQHSRYAGRGEIPSLGWTSINSGGRPHPGGRLAPNAARLYDLSGGMREWTWDGWTERAPRGEDPVSPPVGERRVVKGGSFRLPPARAEISAREGVLAEERADDLGLRLVRSLVGY